MIVNSIFPSSGTQAADFMIQINGQTSTASACLGHSVIFNIYDPVTLKPFLTRRRLLQILPEYMEDLWVAGFPVMMALNRERRPTLNFSYLDTTGRRKMRDFMDWIPAGYFVTARIIF